MLHNELDKEKVAAIFDAPFFKEMVCIIHHMYRLGWDERNGGNLSYRLNEEEIKRYVDINDVKRVLPFNFDASPLAGQYFILTGTGKYFRNVDKSPETVLGLIRINKSGDSAELLWGFEDGGTYTSEFPTHMLCHIKKMAVSPANRVVMHCHPTHLLAMNYIHPLDEKTFTHDLWQMGTECIVVFPEGIGVLPWMLCGTNEIGEATSQKMLEYNFVIWGMHGIYACGKDLDETFGLVETVEKAAQIYMLTHDKPRLNTINDDQLKEIARAFNVKYKKEFLD